MPAKLRSHLTYANTMATLAVFIAVGGSSYAAVTITGRSIKDGSLTGKDVKNRSLAKKDLSKKTVKSLTGKRGKTGLQGAPAPTNAISGANIVNDSLTTADVTGADITGPVSLTAVPNGRCSHVNLAVAGARQGEAVVIATKAAIQDGIVLYGQRVESDGSVEASICNLSGTTMSAIVDLPIRVITFG